VDCLSGSPRATDEFDWRESITARSCPISTTGSGCSGTFGRCAPSMGERSISFSLADCREVVVEKIRVEIKSHARADARLSIGCTALLLCRPTLLSWPRYGEVHVLSGCRHRPLPPPPLGPRSNHARRACRWRMTALSGGVNGRSSVVRVAVCSWRSFRRDWGMGTRRTRRAWWPWSAAHQPDAVGFDDRGCDGDTVFDQVDRVGG
jgi:hypothetical protein